ncbi:MAG: citrate lyase acyl carrier protein [Firmicutes bacterium]|nr:citrate lyase acyl carrier protein [Bacillota bacterium]MBR0375820.1 citrate lyase acyl carrier protein [Bacillota bacterium]MBR3391297.1 citrate lyase acyl carrier protein [Bacillota bacterium]
MELKKPAVAGTVESCDCQVSIFPNPGQGLEVSVESNVKAIFGDSIIESTKDELAKHGVKDAVVQINDKGAFDWIIRARVACAAYRAAEQKFNWKEVE